jgi:hypothetical protein
MTRRGLLATSNSREGQQLAQPEICRYTDASGSSLIACRSFGSCAVAAEWHEDGPEAAAAATRGRAKLSPPPWRVTNGYGSAVHTPSPDLSVSAPESANRSLIVGFRGGRVARPRRGLTSLEARRSPWPPCFRGASQQRARTQQSRCLSDVPGPDESVTPAGVDPIVPASYC